MIRVCLLASGLFRFTLGPCHIILALEIKNNIVVSFYSSSMVQYICLAQTRLFWEALVLANWLVTRPHVRLSFQNISFFANDINRDKIVTTWKLKTAVEQCNFDKLSQTIACDNS